MDKNHEFVVAFRLNNPLGYIASAYYIEENNKSYYLITEPITSDVITKRSKEFDETQIKIVKLIDSYSGNQLAKIFSKKAKNAKDFISDISEADISERIRPYIEKQIIKIIEILKISNIRVFFKEGNYNTFYIEDEIKIHKNSAKTVFNIEKGKFGTNYFLSIRHDKKDMFLLEKPAIIITNSPCNLLLSNDLFSFNDIDGKKLIPFFTKEFISVPKTAEIKWFQTFALNAVKNYTVQATGFKITNQYPEKTAIITLEKDWKNEYSFILKFKYDLIEYSPASKNLSIINFNETSFEFTKITRDIEWENSKIEALSNLGLIIENETSFKINFNKTEKKDQNSETINWLNNNSFKILNEGFLINQSIYKKKYLTEKITLDFKLQQKKDWFDINAKVNFGKFEIPFYNLKNYIINNEREFVLPDNTIALIPDEWFAKYSNLLAFANEKNGILEIKNIHIPVLEEAEIQGIDKNIFNNFKQISQFESVIFELPKDIRAELRPYQKDGFTWMYLLQQNNLGGCLADDMGLGKTLQTITLLKKTIDEYSSNNTQISKETQEIKVQDNLFSNIDFEISNSKKASLIVMPVSLIHNWENEIMKFSPFLKVLKYKGSNRHQKIIDFDKYDIILTGYGVIRNDIELLQNYNFLYLILDESQFVKNPDSKVYKAVSALKSDYKLILTGTPVENSLTDLWAQMNFINDGLLGSRNFFRDTFQIPIEKFNDEIQNAKLKRIINSFFLRRTKQEVAKDLPALSEQTIYCRMTKEQQKIYEVEKSKIRNELLEINEDGIKGNSVLMLQAINQLRQIANHPKMTDVDYLGDSGKFNEIIRDIENIISEKHKVLIFSSFVKHLSIFENYFNENNLKYSILTGKTSDRERVINEFQNDEKNQIFLISIKAGGTGLNLTQADYVIILDPWWNPAAEKQAISRAHRIGQNKKVMVYRYITENSIEEKIQNLQQRKLLLSDDLISNNNPLADISKENFLNLFD